MMKHRMKNFLMVLLAAFLAIGSVQTQTITSFAEESKEGATYTNTDSYVIYYESTEDIDYTYTQPWYWVSPYLPTFSTEGGKPTHQWPMMFNMVNISIIDEDKTAADGPYASVPAYCTDILTGTKTGTTYRRINLEDSSYYDDECAGRIRAIFMNSFPYIKNMEKLEDTVNTWLGTETVTGLTTAEALSATQTAIWIMSNSDESEIYEYCMAEDTGSYSQRMSEIMDTVTVNPDAVDNRPTQDSEVNPPTEQTIKNIENLCKYLLTLEAWPANDTAVSEHSLKDVTICYKTCQDGTYDVTVSYNVDASIEETDKLIISVSCGEVVKAYKLTKSGQDSITINVDKLDDVLLEINGTQTTKGDVYLYEAINGRNTSQNMVAYDTNPVPVHAEVKVTQRVLNFYKTTNTNQGRKALEGVAFDIYLITEDESEYHSGTLQLPEKPTEEYAKESGKFVTTVITDAQGKAICNLSDFVGKGVIQGNGDGIYLIVEKDSPAVEAPIDPFFVCVPMTSADGTGRVYNINIEPKNTAVKGPEIYKDITCIGKDTDSFNVNEEHTWIIRGEIPADIADAKEYKITDVLDYRLTYKGNLVVKVGMNTDEAGQEAVTLTSITDYKVLTGNTSTDGKQVDKLVVYLTDMGMDKVADTVENAGAAYDDYEVRVYFNSVINTMADVGVTIPNQATLEYINSYGYEYDAKSDEPVVYTCGINIYKHDAKNKNNPLEGAKFKLAKVVAQGTEGSATLVTEGGNVNVVYEEFWTSADLTGEKANVAVTDENGAAVICGLKKGTYYLVEIQAPAGYNLLSYPVAVTLNENSHWESHKVDVANSNAFELPVTGGIGTTIFKIVGVVLIGAAVVVLIVKKKKENSDDDDTE